MQADKLVAYLVTNTEASKNVMISNLLFLFLFFFLNSQSLLFLCNYVCMLCMEFIQTFWQWMLAVRFQIIFRHPYQEMLQDHQLVVIFVCGGGGGTVIE